MNLAREPLASRVELKARLDSRDAAVEACRRIGAVDTGTVEQTDTYFSMGRYRLKLRESSDGAHVLVGSSRPGLAQASRTQFRLHRVANPGATKATLARQWGAKVVVSKTRRAFLWQERVRIHIDRVHGLGDFLGFEAPINPESDYEETAARADVARLVGEFGITPRDLVAHSYAELVCGGSATPAGT